jgi:hypothetical protein
LDALFVYKKDNNGKLVLSYHKREAKFRVNVDPSKRELLNLKSSKVACRYRHEAIVVNIEADRNKIEVNDMQDKIKDMGDFKVDYNPLFWNSINLPPDTKFYKKSVKELESIYNVPLEIQFNSSNK